MSEKITVGILRERDILENRVSLVPKDVKLLIQMGLSVDLEDGAGKKAGFLNSQYEDAGEALLYWYHKGPEERERCGEIGRQWVLGDDAKMTAEHLSNSMIESMDTAFEKWTPREKYTLEVV